MCLVGYYFLVHLKKKTDFLMGPQLMLQSVGYALRNSCISYGFLADFFGFFLAEFYDDDDHPISPRESVR